MGKKYAVLVLMMTFIATSAFGARVNPRDAHDRFVFSYDAVGDTQFALSDNGNDSVTFDTPIQKTTIYSEDSQITVSFDGDVADSTSLTIPADTVLTFDSLDITKLEFHNPNDGNGPTDIFVQPWRRQK